ncbi:response regulator [Paenibacillus athensensis]|uniref:Circadian input-output histidine kinase CikA n=1 Tax=Paenibacillus athensensis TaxID=1967502 RepID=A0A4Y8Q3P2_9BACL|nr:response regulator [Paenibacillus athensensis]MCD1258419.1 response regulator [Paenibacillus athensensis]
MSWFNHLKINNKLIVMILLPMLGLIYLTVNSAVDKSQHLAQMDRLQTLVYFTVDINGVVHEFQKERGLVSSYFGTRTASLQSRMLDQRGLTDTAVARLKTSLQTFPADQYGASFASELAATVKELGKLESQRALIDGGQTDTPTAMAYYRGVTTQFFHLMTVVNQLSDDPQVSGALSAYIHFSRSKSGVSQERALLGDVFGKSSLESADIEQTKVLDSEQKLYYNVFASYAQPADIEFYQKTVRGESVTEADRMLQTVLSGKDGQKIEIDPEVWYTLVTDKIDLLKQVEDHYSQNLLAQIDGIKHQALVSLISVVLFNLLVLVLSLGVIFWTSRLMLRQLRLLKQSTQLILEGETHAQADVVSRDEFGDLAEAFNQMVASFRDVIIQADRISQGEYELTIVPRSERDRLSFALAGMLTSLKDTKAENERQNWLKTQLARLTGLSQGVGSVQQLVSMLISEISGLLGVGQGAIYVKEDRRLVEQRDAEFVLLGTYAYSRRKHLNNRFQLGEGLIGQCALEKKPIQLTNAPANYIQITSGLGEGEPLTIVALPILFEDETLAVIELASFQPFTEIQMDLLEQLSATMGVVINSVRGRQRTEELLRESQELAEELQTQQEELRTANEELEEQTNMLRTSEEKLTIQSEELQAINEELEEKTKYLELQKSDIEQQNGQIARSKQELELKAQELELASRYKSEFLANMSHELRTPLNSLLILAKSLAGNDEGNLTEDQVEAAGVIYSGGLDLLTLINDILDLSKVEAGKLSIHREPARLESILRNLQIQFAPVAKERKLQLNLTCDPGVPETIVTDALRVEQILKNLLSNAFKFTPKGSVSVRFYVPGRDVQLSHPALHPGEVLAMAVTDTGIGIPPEKQRAIFEAFQQADGSTSRKYGGTGLGLTISRELAKLLGGEITLASTQGEGSTFTLYLSSVEAGAAGEADFAAPAAAAAAAARETAAASGAAAAVPGAPALPSAPAGPAQAASAAAPAAEAAEEAPPQGQLRSFIPDDREGLSPQDGDKVILIIEDDARFAKVLMDLSRKKGFKCLAAGDGFTALQLAKRYVPGAILLDLGLPDMSGLKVLDHLKFDGETRHIPVHIISGRDDGAASSLKKGAVGFLPKPVTEDELEVVYTRIEHVLNERIKQVLVVEDDARNQKAIVELLKHKKIEIHGAYTAGEGLELLKLHDYDCVILDLTLPDMTGFDMLQRMVDESGKPVPPIIINTGMELSEAEYKQLNRFTDSIVIKGVNSPERLLDEVTLFLHSVQKLLPPEQVDMIRMVHDSDETLKGRKILLVDDDLRNTFALSKVLRQHGLEVVMADNGQLALEKLDKEAGIELVIMDIMMPVMDGYEAMRHIRRNPRFDKLPIIALTAKAMAGDREKSIEGGANDYMTKPVDTDKLLSLIRVWLFR